MEATTLATLAEECGLEISSDEFKLWVLERHIRPKFSASKPNTVTSMGRKALNNVQRPAHEAINDVNKPWRTQSVIDIFAWSVENCNESFVRQHWHTFIPPLLSLVDDSETSIRSHGLCILQKFLTKTPSSVLRETGIGEVFEEAVMPTLLFLPSLTPVDESLALLNPAYDALLQLAEVRFTDSKDRPAKMQALDRIMRRGIEQGLFSSRENVRIVGLLLQKTSELVNNMGLHAVKHLQALVPLLSTILSDPFGTAQPSLILVALRTTQTIMLNCWPRISEPIHYLELIRGLSLCWANLQEERAMAANFDGTKDEIITAGKILCQCMAQKVDVALELAPILEADPSLRQVFTSG